ncbi:MAG TPA: hypothetical protein VHY08_25780 [Bacillota bacterium]|nr:hypothetical protein [Bacillota bacterium]
MRMKLHLIVGVLAVFCFLASCEKTQEAQIRNAMVQAPDFKCRSTGGNTVSMQDLTDFEWGKMYLSPSFRQPSEIYNALAAFKQKVILALTER